MLHKFALIFIAAMLGFTSAHASEKPPELQERFMSSTPYGSAELKWMWKHVYTSHLWLDEAEWSYDAPFALSIDYNMKISRKQLVDKSVEEVERIHGLDEEALSTLETELNRLFPSVKKGDRITAAYVPETHVVFYYNGDEKGRLTDNRLLIPFMDIWMSEQTERPELRRQMLGL